MISRKLVAASSGPIVLSILANGPNYGYAIIQEVRRRSEGEICWTDGMLYPVLHRLERDGSIQDEWRESETGRRRRYYRLTPEGEASLARERREWATVSRALEGLWEGVPCSD